MSHRYGLGFLLAWSTVLCGAVHAQAYPDRPLRMVAPWPPGSTTDGSARIVSEALAKRLNQRVLVENRPGANGTIGSTAVARSPADGYTLLMANGDTHSISPHIYKALQYDALKNFDPVALVATASFVLIARPGLAESTLQDVIAAAKRNPKKLTYGTWGIGSAGHVAFAMLESATGTQLVHVPFQGAAPALAALMGDQVDLMIGSPLAAAVPAVPAAALAGCRAGVVVGSGGARPCQMRGTRRDTRHRSSAVISGQPWQSHTRIRQR